MRKPITIHIWAGLPHVVMVIDISLTAHVQCKSATTRLQKEMGRFRVLQKRLKHRRVKTKWKKALPLSDGSEVNGLKSAKTFTHRSENVSKMKQIEPPKVDPEEKAIKGLEKRLGMKKYKKKELPTEFKMDGLDCIH